MFIWNIHSHGFFLILRDFFTKIFRFDIKVSEWNYSVWGKIENLLLVLIFCGKINSNNSKSLWNETIRCLDGEKSCVSFSTYANHFQWRRWVFWWFPYEGENKKGLNVEWNFNRNKFKDPLWEWWCNAALRNSVDSRIYKMKIQFRISWLF